MRARATWLIGAVALAICVLCPLVDLCDQWDHVLQTGQDTEYPLMILALCVGALFILARLIALFLPAALISRVIRERQLSSAAIPLQLTSVPVGVSPGSPPLSLRV